jgi:Ca2+-dependent lipid-binding protein
MPGKVKVRIVSARHLPVMDRSSENTDAFAEVKFGDQTHKTEVCRKSLNPTWNSEWFRFEAADDRELQDEPLQIRVMDYDTYSANDAIGKVYVDLNPLLMRGNSNIKGVGAPEGRAGGGDGEAPAVQINHTMHGVKSV